MVRWRDTVIIVTVDIPPAQTVVFGGEGVQSGNTDSSWDWLW